MSDNNRMMPETMLCVADFGAKGDGAADDTSAIQTAIDTASRRGGGGVWFPAGQYLSSTLRVPMYVGLFAAPTWSYHNNGGTQLQLCDEKASCLIDITQGYGARVSGLGLSGARLGKGIHGIYMDGAKNNQECTIFVDNCRLCHFTGDAVHLDRAFAFTVRDSMMIFNDGDGLNFSQWDGWVHDCIFNNNGGYGIHARPWNGSLTIVNNRIEWNVKGGVCVGHGSHYSINNNYIDRSGGPGIYLHGGEPVDREYGRPHAYSITGNVIYRSGAKTDVEAHENCHVRLDFVAGVTMTGNVMNTGRNDNGDGQLSPTYGVVYNGLENCLIKDNTWQSGVTREFLVNLGDNEDSVIIKDNLGCVKEPDGK